jgi:hypothetical protein
MVNLGHLVVHLHLKLTAYLFANRYLADDVNATYTFNHRCKQIFHNRIQGKSLRGTATFSSTMSSRPDLSLPAKAPGMKRYHDQSMSLLPAALYTFVDLTDAELQDLQRECEKGCLETGHEPDSSVRPAPQPRFVDQPLRAVLNYHLELGTHEAYDLTYFIAVVEKDWEGKGVILATLDDNDLECNVDLFV